MPAPAYGGRIAGFASAAATEFTWPGLLVVLAGAIVAWRRDWVRCAYLASSGLLAAPFALGFKAEADTERYLLPLFFAGAIFAGDFCGAAGRRLPRFRDAIAMVPVLLAAVLILQQQSLFAQPRDVLARAAIDEVQSLTPPNAILIATWAYAPPLGVRDVRGGLDGSANARCRMACRRRALRSVVDQDAPGLRGRHAWRNDSGLSSGAQVESRDALPSGAG